MEEVELMFKHSFVVNLHNLLIDAKENSYELLNDHDAKLGRTTRKNQRTAEMYEKEIKELEIAIHVVSKKLSI